MSSSPPAAAGGPLGAGHPFLDHPGPVVYAHRGGGAEAPENSVAAFANAVAIGFRYLETDARRSADGVLFAVHDDRLERVSDGTGRVSERSSAYLARLRLRDRRGRLTAERLPLLEELIERWPQARWNIDAKHDAVVDPLGALLERLELFERCCVGAFSDARLERLRSRFGSALCTSLGPREVARLRVSSVGVPVAAPTGRVAQVPVRAALGGGPLGRRVGVPLLDGRFLRVCARQRIPVHVWTVNDPAVMADLLERGVQGFMTDCPTVAAEVLAGRGRPLSG